MPDESIINVLTKKIGHGLEEVRVRALDTVLSKLDRGFLDLKDFLKTKDFLVKLLEWFGLQPCPRQEQVLGLILCIMKEDAAGRLVAQIGATRLLLALNTIRTVLPTELCASLDDITSLVRRMQAVQEDNMSQNIPLKSKDVKSSGNAEDQDMDALVQEVLMLHSKGQSSAGSVLQDDINRRGDGSQHPSSEEDSRHFDGAPPFSSALKQLLLPWQPLVSTDRHVLVAVQESLSNLADRPQLLHTCRFLTDVMMRDFPAEVFLQRPAIVMTFMKLLKASLLSDDCELASVVIDCLTKLTTSLRSRLKHYQDPNFANLKQENCLLHLDESSSQLSMTHSLRSTLNREEQAEAETQAQDGTGDWSRPSSQNSSSSPSQANSQGQSKPPTDDERFPYHTTQVDSESAGSEDSVSLQLQQCSLPQFCVITLRYSLPHVDSHTHVGFLLAQTSRLLTECVSPQLWLAPATDAVATDIATHLHEVLAMLGELLQQDRPSGVARLIHLQLLAVTRLLLCRLVPLELADQCLPRQLKTALCASILDGPLHAFFPTLYAHLLQYVQVFKNVRDVESVRLFEDTLSVAESLNSAAHLLNQVTKLNGPDLVHTAERALPSLAFHRDLRIVPVLLDSCSAHYSSWQLSEGERRTLSAVLLKLMAHGDDEVRNLTYFHLHKLVLDVLSVRQLNCPPEEALAFLLFDSAILLEIITHGIASTDEKVHSCAEDIVLHAIKGQSILGKNAWMRFMSCLTPALPLLQCWAEKSSALGRAVITMLNPDVGSQMNLATPELLKGNLRLLFSLEDKTRVEALSRLTWLLTREENAFDKLPPITRLHGCVNDRVCLIDRPCDPVHSVPNEPFYQESSLLQVVELTQTDTIDSRVRLSALSQLAVMLEDPRLHEAFLSHGGLGSVLDILQHSISDKAFDICPESIIPTVSILHSVCLHHSLTRHQLAQNMNVFYCVFRGLLLFSADSGLHNHAAQLLAILLYSDIILSAAPHSLSDGFVVRALSLPDLVVRRMHLPFVCPTHWRTSHFTEPLMADVLLRHEVCRAFLSTAWNLSYFKRQLSPLMWDIRTSRSLQVTSAEEKFSQDMRLSDRDLCTLQASALLSTCRLQLSYIENATTHQNVSAALLVLTNVLTLRGLLTGWREVLGGPLADTSHLDKEYGSLSWRSTLRRFLAAAPASFDDQQLLVHVLRFLQVHVQTLRSIGNSSQDHFWLCKLLKNPSQPLPNLLCSVWHSEGTEVAHDSVQLPKWKEVCRELLATVTECTLLERKISSVHRQTESVKGHRKSEGKENKFHITSKKKKVKSTEKDNVRPNSRQSDVDLDSVDRWVDEVVASATGARDGEYRLGWTHVIQNVVNCLRSSDTQRFYNLAFLDWLLWALTHLMGSTGWSRELGAERAEKMFSELIQILLELVQAFHFECGKGGSSCMGLSITRATIICMNNLLAEMQMFSKDWETVWKVAVSSGIRSSGTSLWVISLWQSREPVVRAASMQLAVGLTSTSRGSACLLEMLASELDPVWMPPLCYFLDHEEASTVREHATNFLCNIVRYGMHSAGSNQPVEHNKVKGSELASTAALHERLLECNFLPELWTVLSRLSLSVSCEPCHLITGNMGVALKHWTDTSLSWPLQSKNNINHLPSDEYVLVHSRPASVTDSLERTPVSEVGCVAVTPALVRAICNFLDCFYRSNSSYLEKMAQEGLSIQLLRCLGNVPSFGEDSPSRMLYCDTISMYGGVCRVLAHCVTSHSFSHESLAQQPDTMHKLLLILDPSAYPTSTSELLELRNKVWSEALWLLSALFASTEARKDSCTEAYSALHGVLIRSRGESLLSVLVIALTGSAFTGLQRAALACLQALLSHPASGPGQPLACLLDNPDADLNSSVLPDREVNLDGAAGADLCRALLRLYDVHSLQLGSDDQSASVGWRAQRSAVTGALSALLMVSVAAKQVALKHGFVQLLYGQLGQLHAYLVLEPIKTMRRLSGKKRVCPVLQDVELVMGLLTTFAHSNVDVKTAAADVGVTDLIHKLWVWCENQTTLMLNALNLLVTLTAHCLPASHSLVLTTTVPGLSLRRSPSSQNLLHTLVALALQETDQANSSQNLEFLILSSNVLLNACHVPECRAALTKGNLSSVIHRLYTNISKKSHHWERIEALWLRLLLQLTAYQEGQVVLPKVPDFFEFMMNLVQKKKRSGKAALQILRNIAFKPVNRPRLLSCGDFLQLINSKIRVGDPDEQVAAAATVWALTANNQKGKLLVKCAGTDICILDTLRQLAVSHRDGADYVAKLLSCVLRVLHAEERRTL